MAAPFRSHSRSRAAEKRNATPPPESRQARLLQVRLLQLLQRYYLKRSSHTRPTPRWRFSRGDAIQSRESTCILCQRVRDDHRSKPSLLPSSPRAILRDTQDAPSPDDNTPTCEFRLSSVLQKQSSHTMEDSIMALEARSLDPFAGIFLIKASPGRSLEQAFGSFALLQDTHDAVVLVPWRTKSSDWPWTHLS